MTADAFTVVSLYVTSHNPLILLDPLNGILWAVDDAVVTFEAESATHATLGLADGCLLCQAVEAFDHAS
jgi:hypothetical protein